jgi:putrescine transport system ATP-binding protein
MPSIRWQAKSLPPDLGSASVYSVKLDQGAVRGRARQRHRVAADEFSVGQRVGVSFTPDDVVVLDR